MKVVHVYRTYFPDTQGGLEEVIRQICLGTRDFNVTSRVFTLSKQPVPPVISLEEAEVYRARQTVEISSCGMGFTSLRPYVELVAWADIVHYHFPWPFADFLYFAGRTKKPTVITYHSDIVRQKVLGWIYEPLMHKFLDAADCIVATSPNYLSSSKVLRTYAQKVSVIPIGLHDHVPLIMHPSRLTESLRGERFFFFVGVLRYYKGLHILLDAIQNAPYKIVIAGAGPEERDLKQRAGRLGLSNVVFAGRISDSEKHQLLHLCEAIVFPSHQRSEAFGVTLLEGARASKPLISTEVGTGTSYVNEQGVTGFVVDPGSPAALREAMDYLHHNPDVAAEMGEAARKRYESHFTGRIMGERYSALYRGLLAADTTAEEAC